MFRKWFIAFICLMLAMGPGFVMKPNKASAAPVPWNLINDELNDYTLHWENFGTGGGSVTQQDGYVTILDQSDKAHYLLRKSFTAPTGAFTFEVKAKVNAANTLNEFSIRSGSYLISFYLTYGTAGKAQSSVSNPSQTVTLDTTVYHTYRIVVHEDYSYDLYVDGIQAWSGAPKLTGTGSSVFKIGGDSLSSANLDLDYVRLGTGEMLPSAAIVETILPSVVHTTSKVSPILPSVVTAVYDDLTEKQVPVVWDNVDPSHYAQEGTFNVLGHVAGTAHQAMATVVVTAAIVPIVAIEAVNVTTPVKTMPILPAVVTALHSDSSTSSVPVVWDVIPPKSYMQTGSFSVNGVAEGTTISAVAHVTVNAEQADEFDSLREKLKVMLTGGTSIDQNDPDIALQITALTSKAQAQWSSMDKSTGRTYLWSDLASTTISAHITATYTRLKELAIAYSTPGSSLYHDDTLLTDMISALDWMNTNRYNTVVTRYDNWWDWWIGAPIALNETVVILYDQLSPLQITNYMNAVNRFTPKVDMTAANRVWQSQVVAVRGIIVKDAAKIAHARDGLSNVLTYVTSKDGFYKDGSFIQHDITAYNGGYGATMLLSLSDLMYVLGGSTWEVTDPNVNHVYQWIYDSFEPLMYKGLVMDMTRGREISRSYATDHLAGRRVTQAVIRISQMAPPEHAANFKSMVKHWITANTYVNFYLNLPINQIVLGKSITNDASLIAREAPNQFWQFANMDEAVVRRPEFSWGLKMFSSRTSNFETGNGENLKGWHTGDGMTYLYNSDLGQFSDDFWPTVNPYRLPGTTVDTLIRSNGTGGNKVGKYDWIGGTEMSGTFGVSGMELDGLYSTLTAKKSWFVFDDEIVSLGSGITSTDNRAIETIVENRKISGDNVFTVNGTAKPSSIGWTEKMKDVSWGHLQGNVTGSDIGYYFPTAASVEGLREARTGKYTDIDNRSGTPNTPINSNYLTLWFDHGISPSNTTYQYVTLPNFSAQQTGDYAEDPDIVVLENTEEVQAVKERKLSIIGANFWKDMDSTVMVDGVAWISSNKKASVMTRETSSNLDVSVADPTHVNTGTIDIEINAAATGVHSIDPGITITRLSPTIMFTVNAAGASGATFHASFNVVPPSEKPHAPTIKEVKGGNQSATVSWSGVSSAKGYYVKYGMVSGEYTHRIPLGLESSFTVNGLSAGTPYYFAVSAYNQYGEGPNSEELMAEPIEANWNLIDDHLTDFTAGWYGQGTGAGAVTQKDGFVTILDQGDRAYYLIRKDFAAPTGAFSFEVQARAGAAETMNEFSVRSDQYLISFYLTYGTEGKVQNKSSNPSKSFVLDTTVFHTYTVVTHSDYTYDLYVDGKRVWKDAHNLGAGTPLIKIGGDSASFAHIDLDHVKMGNGEIAPPEPAIATLVPVDVDTMAGVAPILPATISVVYDDGTTETAAVIWDSIDTSLYLQSGSFDITGAVLGTHLRATAHVTVAANPKIITSIEKVNMSTAVGVAPLLPAGVLVTYSDSSTSTLPVIWEVIQESKYSHPGSFDVNGEVAGTTISAVAAVTVQSSSNGGSGGGETPSGPKDKPADNLNDKLKATTTPIQLSELPEKTLKTVGDSSVYRVGAKLDGKVIDQLGDHKLSVAIAYSLKPGEAAHKLVISYVNAEGELEVQVNGAYDAATGQMEFKASQLGVYVIHYNDVIFSDIGAMTWANQSIEALAARGIIKGVGENKFMPNRSVSRAEFVTLLMRAFGLDKEIGEGEFTDVSPDDWYYRSISAAQSLGIVNGRLDGSFGAGVEITRQDMAVITYRTLQALKLKLNSKEKPNEFTDYADIAGYANEAVSTMQSAAIIEGNGNKFYPNELATRAQAAVMLYRLLNQLK
jgi:hyaluronate lyase